MTKEYWSTTIRDAINDPEALNLLCEILIEQDQAKHLLRELGFGVSGTKSITYVQEIIEEYCSLEAFADSYYP